MKRKWDWKNAAMAALLFGMGMALGLAAVIDLHERVQTQGFGGYLFSVAWLAVAAVLYPNSKTAGSSCSSDHSARRRTAAKTAPAHCPPP